MKKYCISGVKHRSFKVGNLVLKKVLQKNRGFRAELGGTIKDQRGCSYRVLSANRFEWQTVGLPMKCRIFESILSIIFVI